MYTGASDGLEGFKAHAVFQEINKKLLEVTTQCKNGTQDFLAYVSWHVVMVMAIEQLKRLIYCFMGCLRFDLSCIQVQLHFKVAWFIADTIK